MKASHELEGIDTRRQRVATFIENNLQPVNLLTKQASDSIETDTETKLNNFEVRDYQLDAWSSIWEARQRGTNKALVHLATGLGKTSVAIFDVIKFREEYVLKNPGTTPRVLFVSHMNDISDQAKQRFQDFIPNTQYGAFRAKQKDLPNSDITFATFQSLHNSLDRFDPNYFQYIIYDEAHHTEAETFSAVRSHFSPDFELALTATPNRMDELDIREYFGEAVYSKTLAEAIAEGWLADVDYHIVFDDIVKQLMEEGFEPKTLREFHELFKIQPRNETIANNIKQERHKIGLDAAKTIVFCEDVSHAKKMAELLNGAAYHSAVPKDFRKNILDDFRSGACQVICTVDMFNEGIDIPDARLIVFLRSTQSGTIFEQQLGRGLRKAPGKDKVSVLDFVANIERIQTIKDLSERMRRYSEEFQDESLDSANALDQLPGEETLDGSGLRLHVSHADFDFDRIAVDLLEKWGYLKENAGERSEWSPYSNEELVELAISLSPAGELFTRRIHELSKKKIFPGVQYIKKRFGSIIEFQRACGFDVRSRSKISELTNEELIDLAIELSPDQPMDINLIKQLSKNKQFISPGTLRTRFGSLVEFQRACGFEMYDWIKITNEELIDLALRLSPENPLTVKDLTALSKEDKFPGIAFIARRFGSLANFQEACGFDAIKTYWNKMTNEEIIALALQLSPDQPITRSVNDRLSRAREFPGVDFIKERFGSVREFQKACGFKN